MKNNGVISLEAYCFNSLNHFASNKSRSVRVVLDPLTGEGGLIENNGLNGKPLGLACYTDHKEPIAQQLLFTLQII